MAEAHDVQGARRETLAAAERAADFFPLDDLPNDVLVSVFMAVGDLLWVRHTVPCVCKAWNELYCSKDASPLHETLEVDFEEEAWEEEATEFHGVFCIHLVEASRVISWAERHAGSVRKLHIKAHEDFTADFSSEDLGALIAAVGPSLTEIRVRFGFVDQEQYEKRFWKSLRDSVVPAGRLRSLVVEGMESVPLDSDVEPLGQLAGSLEELDLGTVESDDEDEAGLPRFPESFCALKMLRRLILAGHPQITEIPVGISSLKKLEELELSHCGLSSLPKELVELSGLTTLILGENHNLGNTPQDQAFPAELGRMKSLRGLNLERCGLRTFPAFVGKLESLEVLHLCCNAELQIDAPLDFLVEGCPRLREVELHKENDGFPWTPESQAHLDAFKAKLRAKNPNARVRC